MEMWFDCVPIVMVSVAELGFEIPFATTAVPTVSSAIVAALAFGKGLKITKVEDKMRIEIIAIVIILFRFDLVMLEKTVDRNVLRLDFIPKIGSKSYT